jgi:hypothetical protein
MRDITMLVPWQEVVGRLIRLEERLGALYVETPTHIVICPVEVKEKLSPYLGSRISLLRTDIVGVGKEYLIRVLQEPHSDIGQTAQVHYDGEMVSEAV